MIKRGTPLLILCAVFFISTAGCIGTSVKPGERGLVWHPLTAGLEKEPLKDGFYWKWPWNDVYRYDVRWQSYSENVDAWSADDLQIVVKAAIILRPNPEDLYNLAQTVGNDYYVRVVKPEFLAAVRSAVSEYTVVAVPEKSVDIAKKVQTVLEAKLKNSHLAIQSVALADVDFPQIVLTAIEQKKAKEQEKEQKEFELLIADKDAEIARARAKGDGDATQIRAEGQAKAQGTITKTLTPEYLRYKLYDNQNSKMVLLPDNLKLPVLINPGEQQSNQSMKSEDSEQSAKLPSPSQSKK
jgi:regulator of protease activity HflC (stomatin/prohibitin superfamily)